MSRAKKIKAAPSALEQAAATLDLEQLLDDVTAPAPPVLNEAEQPKDPVDAAIERAVITDNDPDGRQPGDPNSAIELPPELLAGPASNPNMIAFDSAEDLDKFLSSLPKAEPVVRPDVPSDALPQPAELSAKTLAELSAGRNAVVHSTEQEAQQVADGAKEPPFRPSTDAASAAFSRPAPMAEELAGVPVLHPRTIAEQEAGREALKRKGQDIAAARAAMANANAVRLKKGGKPDAGDLSYVPR